MLHLSSRSRERNVRTQATTPVPHQSPVTSLVTEHLHSPSHPPFLLKAESHARRRLPPARTGDHLQVADQYHLPDRHRWVTLVWVINPVYLRKRQKLHFYASCDQLKHRPSLGPGRPGHPHPRFVTSFSKLSLEFPEKSVKPETRAPAFVTSHPPHSHPTNREG